MELQQLQLDQLGEWLQSMEQRIEEQGLVSADLEALHRQIEQHKELQDEMEQQQEHVNSLQNMVVVVDESNSESGMMMLTLSKARGSNLEMNFLNLDNEALIYNLCNANLVKF